jgi:hypothetical protein
LSRIVNYEISQPLGVPRSRGCGFPEQLICGRRSGSHKPSNCAAGAAEITLQSLRLLDHIIRMLRPDGNGLRVGLKPPKNACDQEQKDEWDEREA